MKNMYKSLIKKYLDKITINDILEYAKKEKIVISIRDAHTILYYAKTYYQDLLNGNEIKLKELKEHINIETYKVVYKKYLEMKIKYLT